VSLGPAVGIDFAAVMLDGGYLIVSSDPVTGVEDDVGWYAVNVCANDVATSGARPRFLNSVILLPIGADEKIVRKIARQISGAAKDLGMMVLGGHTEVTPGLKRPAVIITAMGLTDHYVTAGDAKEGDAVVMTKTAGIEGTSILARTCRDRLDSIGIKVMLEAEEMIRQISVVEDAKILFATGKVHAMHDPTEGGVLGGVYEMAVASGLGYTLHLKEIAVASATSAVCNILNADPARLIGSGCLLAAVDPNAVDEALEKLNGHEVSAKVIGYFGGEDRQIVRLDGSVEQTGPVTDELWRLIGDQADEAKRV
jgi:hydrogenase expression/formation protein HypE